MDGQYFHTFIITNRTDAMKLASIAVPDDWALSTHEDPSLRHWDTVDGVFTSERPNLSPQSDTFTEKYSPCREIIIHAKDERTATNVQSLIHGGIILAYPDLHSFGSTPDPIEIGTVQSELLTCKPFCNYFAYHNNTLHGCTVASKAWKKRSLIYAIEKLKLSLSLDSISPHSASPIHGQIFANAHPEYSYHVNAAYAIVTAYSAIEELGLEVRSSQKRPRFLGKHNDTWNPDVRKDLIERINAAGIDDSEMELWVYRGSPTPVENKIRPVLGTSAPYSRADVVRDRELHLTDAIHYASWIRNFVTAHKFNDRTESLSPYDVHNVQSLARRLILDTMNLWKNWPPSN